MCQGKSASLVCHGGVDMREHLTVAVAQPPCISYDVEANAMAHVAAIRAADADVVVFPELSMSGYELDAEPISLDDPLLAPIVDASAETDSLALIGAPVETEPGRPRIAMVGVDGAGATVRYSKIWLHGTEAERFRPGSEPAVIEVRGWRLGLAICRDTGVAQHAADTAALGIDVYVAGVAETADRAAVQDERARRTAIAHRVWVAVASFAGPTGGGFAHTAGRSAIWTPEGVAVVRAGREPGDIARATLRETSLAAVSD
jgi:predicted amidohydrolase